MVHFAGCYVICGFFSVAGSCGVDLPKLEDIHKLPVAAGNAGHGCVARDVIHTKVHECFPESRPAHCKADEPANPRRRCQPFPYFSLVFTSTQDDATHIIPAVTASSSHDILTVFTAIESFDLPDIRLDARVLQLLNCRVAIFPRAPAIRT
jgi:hypothetical protein